MQGRRIAQVALATGAALVGREIIIRWRSVEIPGQVVVITGGSRGLGFAMAQEYARQGARLVICARNEDDLERARAQLEASGAEVLAVECDVTDPEQVRKLIERATAHFGRVDVLVNNAGTIIVGPVEAQTLEDFEQAMDTMFWGVYHSTMAVLPQMTARGDGRIVNITSIGGKVSVPHLLSYSTAKFAAVAFSEGLRAELAQTGVTVVTVVPGLMRTGSHVNALFKGRERQEYGWFSLGASLPLVSISASLAARQIVEATRRGSTEITLSPQAQLLSRFHGLFPGATVNVLSVVNRLLPEAESADQQPHLGRRSKSALSQSFLTKLGRRAARTYQPPPETEHDQPG